MPILKNMNQKPQKMKSHIPFRLNVLFFIVFLLFAALIVQLGYLQIIHGETFAIEAERSGKQQISGSVPRGMIYDSKQRILVGNKANQAISYTKGPNVEAKDMYKIAGKLDKLITIPNEKLTERDKKDFFLADPDHLKMVQKRISKRELQDAEGNPIGDKQEYKLLVSRVKDSEIKLDEHEKHIASIFKRMNSAYQLDTIYIKSKDVTNQEIAEVSENLSKLPGINTANDWERQYPQGDSMRSILGSVSTEKQGLPEDRINALLAEGYARNDRIGKSYIEEQYEPVLKGSKSVSEIELNSDNQIIKSLQEYKGAKGGNLVTTIDMDFQKKTEEIVKKYFSQMKSSGAGPYSEGTYVVALNPKTGAILAMAGQYYDMDKEEQSDDALGTMNRAFVPGSMIKGATVLSALMDGTITTEDNTLFDEPVYIKGTNPKSSWNNRPGRGNNRNLTAVQALEESSNAYMMKLMFKMDHKEYVPNAPLNLNVSLFDKMTNYYKQFGLGTSTWIDLPGETTGYLGKVNDSNLGSILDMAYGNFAAYSTMQLAQYISTIANGGYRMAPYIVQEIRGTDKDGNLGQVEYSREPKILNKLNASSAQMKLVQEGFYEVVHGAKGTGAPLASEPYNIAGKTGTGETFTSRSPGTVFQTTSFGGYAPADNPEIAIAVIMPNINELAAGSSYSLGISKEVFKAYFDIKEGKKVSNEEQK